MNCMETKYIKSLIDKVESINVDHKNVEKKEFDDYLNEKKLQGSYKGDIISFNDSEDYAYFEKLISNLGLDIADILK